MIVKPLSYTTVLQRIRAASLQRHPVFTMKYYMQQSATMAMSTTAIHNTAIIFFAIVQSEASDSATAGPKHNVIIFKSFKGE